MGPLSSLRRRSCGPLLASPSLFPSSPFWTSLSHLFQPSAVPRSAATGFASLTPPLRLHGGCLCHCQLLAIYGGPMSSQLPDWLSRGRGAHSPYRREYDTGQVRTLTASTQQATW
ncbi:hypothetical protein N431DRAFT_245173 [Stipitochalara longipes BDJ]|nr:hypothetical protein N431DRAFT_245173 [Stipitochalara longipes BDJ]